jgi:hypothetical protein
LATTLQFADELTASFDVVATHYDNQNRLSNTGSKSSSPFVAEGARARRWPFSAATQY